MFELPGIINPNKTVNFDIRVLTDERGEFEVAISEPFRINQGFPSVEVIVSMDNGVEVERILHDKVGILAQKRDVGNGLEQIFWGNRARNAVCGFLFRRGTYKLQAFVDGKQTALRQIVSQSDPARDDWQSFTYSDRLHALPLYADMCVPSST